MGVDDSSGKVTKITYNVDVTSGNLSPNFYLSSNDFIVSPGDLDEFPRGDSVSIFSMTVALILTAVVILL